MEILLLTENILAEEKLQSKIQLLGHEVFVNKSFLTNVNDIFHINFDVYIVSNTIPKSKEEEIKSHATKRAIGIIFVCDSLLGKESTSLLEKIYITRDEALEDLKEKLEVSSKEARIRMHQMDSNKEKEHHMVNTDLQLSTNEQRVFSLLTEHEDDVLSREEICRYVWDSDYTDSRKSQLSSLIKRINIKMKTSSMSSHEIKTLWGRGYAFSKVS
ncbi:winged helix-turn-helix domain-containing protein [Enterococcus sp. DIV0187]|uniref:winged helix-turn-helix domain-containing protein n=1 Tax=Enterococcus sp. DIV0187 TaxID=2774644 RepID=UPI003F22AA50